MAVVLYTRLASGEACSVMLHEAHQCNVEDFLRNILNFLQEVIGCSSLLQFVHLQIVSNKTYLLILQMEI